MISKFLDEKEAKLTEIKDGLEDGDALVIINL